LAVGTADHVMLSRVLARRQKRADRLAVEVAGLHHEPFERQGPVDGRERDVHQVSGDHGRGWVHRQLVRARDALRVLRLVTWVSGRHVRARDLELVVGDGPGADQEHQQQRRGRLHGRSRHTCATGFCRHRDYRAVLNGIIIYDGDVIIHYIAVTAVP